MFETLMSNIHELRAAELHERIEVLFECFRKYYLRPKLNLYLKSEAIFHEIGLRHLPVEVLDEYLPKAISTWGNLDNFKYFVPRLLELLVTTWSTDTYYLFLGFKKADWLNWPTAESNAVHEFFLAALRLRLTQPFGNNGRGIDKLGYAYGSWMSFPVDCFFDDLRDIQPNFKSFLSCWEDELRQAVDLFPIRLHLAFIIFNIVFAGGIPETFRFPIQIGGRVSMDQQILDWLKQDSIGELLEDSFYRWPDRPEAEIFSQAAEFYKKWKRDSWD
jgi:hypothetical protein